MEQNNGRTQTAHLFTEAVPLICREVSPLCIKGTCGMRDMSKIFREPGPNGTAQKWDWKEEVRSPGLRKKLNYQSLLLRVVFLCTIPDYWSAVPVRTQCVLQLLTSTWQSHASL